MSDIKLTSLSKASGCGCKIAPAILKEILKTSYTNNDENLLVGNHHNDDASVYAINNDQAIINTVDFFTPIVDDAFMFGKIAAANAISDVYAMGGKPLTALATLSWPLDNLTTAIAQQVLEGARATCKDAGIIISGGHSIDGKDALFGLSVSGLIAIKNIKQNKNAQAGDVLILTKPLGLGILSAALKRDLISPEDLIIFYNHASALNNVGEALGALEGVHAMTDITGFGLLGHLHEICEASQCSAILNYSSIPIIPNALPYLQNRVVPDATFRNWNAYKDEVQFEPGVNVMEAFSTLPDPQTNGGLLICCAQNSVAAVMDTLQKFNTQAQSIIGSLTPPNNKIIVQP